METTVVITILVYSAALVVLTISVILSLLILFFRPKDWKKRILLIFPMIPLMFIGVMRSFFAIMQLINTL